MAAIGIQDGDNNQQAPQGANPPKAILPADRVFSVQVGTELFKISGASIASDVPSYFSEFFAEQIRASNGSNVRTLYIDRDAETFRDVVRHLQGYYVRPTDNEQLVKLLVDSIFYNLPRLTSQLLESGIPIQIGDRHFNIPRNVISSPGNSPNFFTLGFGFFLSPDSSRSSPDFFPGLDRDRLLRPPSVAPPFVPNRSGDVFAEILHLLRGYPLRIRDGEHRESLLRDCRYYHFRELEQRIVPHEIGYNPVRRREEIFIRVQDVRDAGVHFAGDGDSDNTGSSPAISRSGRIVYARPLVDDKPRDLIIETGGDSTTIDLDGMRADFHNQTTGHVSRLLKTVAVKISPVSGKSIKQSDEPARLARVLLGGDRVKVQVDRNTDLTIDGEVCECALAAVARAAGTSTATTTTTTMIPSDPNLDPDPDAARPSKRQRTDPNPDPNPHPRSETDFNPQLPQTAWDSPNMTGGWTSDGGIDPATLMFAGINPPTTQHTPNGPRTGSGRTWFVRVGQWRLRVRPNGESGGKPQLVFVAVKLDVYTVERGRNRGRGFLGGQ